MTQAEILTLVIQVTGLALVLGGGVWKFGQKLADFERRMEARSVLSERVWAEQFGALRYEVGTGFAELRAAGAATTTQVAGLSRCHDEDVASRRHQGERIEALGMRLTVVETRQEG